MDITTDFAWTFPGASITNHPSPAPNLVGNESKRENDFSNLPKAEVATEPNIQLILKKSLSIQKNLTDMRRDGSLRF